MRMRRSLKKKYYHKISAIQRDNEGNRLKVWKDATPIDATIWSASGKIQAEMYGERLAYIKNMEYEGEVVMQEGDGICVYVDADKDPDYRIISIKPEYSPIRMELEKIGRESRVRRG